MNTVHALSGPCNAINSDSAAAKFLLDADNADNEQGQNDRKARLEALLEAAGKLNLIK